MTDDTKSIDEILSQPQDQAPQEAAQPDTVTEDKPQQPRDERGKFAPKQPAEATAQSEPGETIQEQAPPAAQPQNSQPPQGYVPLAALVDQRLEARQAKQRLQELERQLAEAQRPKQDPVDFYADPEAALNQRLQPLQQRFDQTISNLTLRASKAEAIAVHGKQSVDEMEKAIGEAMEAGDPEVMQLRQHLLSSDDPVGVAMQWYARRKVLSEVGSDPAAYRERLKAEILAELNGGGNAPAQQQQKAPAVMPSNLSAARNVGTRSGSMWGGPTPITDIFKR